MTLRLARKSVSLWIAARMKRLDGSRTYTGSFTMSSHRFSSCKTTLGLSGDARTNRFRSEPFRSNTCDVVRP